MLLWYFFYNVESGGWCVSNDEEVRVVETQIEAMELSALLNKKELSELWKQEMRH